MSSMQIESRKRHLINTDSQCVWHNGSHFKSELIWGKWEILEYEVLKTKVKKRLDFWGWLNSMAVRDRGEKARREFRVQPKTQERKA